MGPDPRDLVHLPLRRSSRSHRPRPARDIPDPSCLPAKGSRPPPAPRPCLLHPRRPRSRLRPLRARDIPGPSSHPATGSRLRPALRRLHHRRTRRYRPRPLRARDIPDPSLQAHPGRRHRHRRIRRFRRPNHLASWRCVVPRLPRSGRIHLRRGSEVRDRRVRLRAERCRPPSLEVRRHRSWAVQPGALRARRSVRRQQERARVPRWMRSLRRQPLRLLRREPPPFQPACFLRNRSPTGPGQPRPPLPTTRLFASWLIPCAHGKGSPEPVSRARMRNSSRPESSHNFHYDECQSRLQRPSHAIISPLDTTRSEGTVSRCDRKIPSVIHRPRDDPT